MAKRLTRYFNLLPIYLCLVGCSSYKQSLFLKIPDNVAAKSPTQDLLVPSNETISPFDQLGLEVYAANGERLIDPDRALSKTTGGLTSDPERPTYLVDKDGIAKFPLVGEQSLRGLTIRAAEQMLQTKYNAFYKDCFVVISTKNNRVTVISNGGVAVPLPNEGMTVLEVIGLAGDVSRDAKTSNIRLLRANEVILLDLSEVANYPTHNVLVQSGDIIYLEPVRRPFVEGLRDTAPLIGLVISILTLLIFYESTR